MTRDEAKRFGARLKRALSTKKAYEILDSAPEIEGTTWTAGGCWWLAEAVASVTGGRLVALYNEENIPQHVLVLVDDIFLDGDGASTAKTIIKRWTELEGVKGAYLSDFWPSLAREHGIVCPRIPRELIDLVRSAAQ